MRKIGFFVVFLLFGSLLVTNCGKTTANSTSTTSVTTTTIGPTGYFPHEDGDTWVYSYKQWSDNSSPVNTTYTWQFSGEVTVLGNRTQRFRFREGFQSWVDSYYTVEADGVNYYGDASSPTSEGKLFLPLPLQIGEVSNYEWPLQSITTREVAAYESVYANNVLYNDCFRVDVSTVLLSEGYIVRTSIWYAPNIGKVKSISYFFRDAPYDYPNGITTQELTSKNF
jgi:hypothetical protein